MKKNILTFLLCAVLFPFIVDGQPQVVPLQTRPEEPFRPAWIIKFAPLSLTDIDPTVQGAVEYLFCPNVSVQQEIGFLKIANWISIDEKYPRSIFRSRTEVRLYISKRRKAPMGSYLALEGFYKYINQPREGEINRGSYFEIKNYRYVKSVSGAHFKFGAQATIGGSDQWLLDGYIGFGLRSIRLRATSEDGLIENIPESPLDILSIEDNRGHYAIPSMCFGLKFGYVIGALKRVKAE